jgi:hypothetical protein
MSRGDGKNQTFKKTSLRPVDVPALACVTHAAPYQMHFSVRFFDEPVDVVRNVHRKK